MSLSDQQFDIGLALRVPSRAREPHLIKALADELVATDSEAVRDQHVVSKVLLKRFCSAVKGSPRVSSYRISTGTAKLTGLDTAGMIPIFLR